MLANLIKSYRQQNKLTVRQLALIIGIGHTVLWRFETGKDIRGKQWMKIAHWALIGPTE